MRDLRVSEETTDSFRVSWQPAPGGVARYRVTYEPVGDESMRRETVTFGLETTTVLQELQPKTTYSVTVTPEYPTSSGEPLQTEGTTKEGNVNSVCVIVVKFRLFDSTVTCVICVSGVSTSVVLLRFTQIFKVRVGRQL